MFAVEQLPCDQCCSDVPSPNELTLMPAGQTNRGQIQAMFLCGPEAGTRSHARGLCISTGLVLVLFLDKALCAPFSESLVTEIVRNTPLKHLEEKGEDQERK